MKQENTFKTAQLTYKRRSQSAEIWRRFKKSKTAIIGLIMLSVLVLLAIFADVITPYDAEKSDAAGL